MMLIFAFSAMPSDSDRHIWWVFALRKVAHFSEYALLCVLWFRALREHLTVDHALIGGVVLSLGYAITDEFHQTFVGGRVGTWHDIVIDTAGALTAAWLIRRRYSQPRSVASSTA
jgi:VanZ family protein